MHPLLAEALVAAHQADIDRAVRAPRLTARDLASPAAPRRRPARVAVGMRLIDLGLRLVDVTPAAPVC